ncbi:MAG: hypothetical protein EOO65_04665 [Methanosarcinales archaeon]|nr:MAG: hypothetical protein EOO65_04665 [Methanosarcinales archaeon]
MDNPMPAVNGMRTLSTGVAGGDATAAAARCESGETCVELAVVAGAGVTALLAVLTNAAGAV